MTAGTHPVGSRRARIGRIWGPRLFALNILGYSAVALFSTAMNWDSTIASIPFRAFVLGLALLLIFQLGRRSSWWRQARWPLLFAGLYLLRLVFDSFVTHIPGSLEITGFFIVTVLIPSVAQGLASEDPASDRRTAWLLAFTGAAICAGAILLQLFSGSARMLDPSHYEGRLGFEALNPIGLGHAAATTLISVLYLMLYKSSTPVRALLAVIAGIAALCLLSAGSRGPIISLGFAGLVYAIITRRWRWIFAIVLLIAFTLLRTETSVVDRFAAGGVDESSMARFVIQANAITQYLASPIFGSAYAELESLEYPHNLFIETAMALGTVGLLLLLALLFSTFFSMRREWRRKQVLAPLLFVQYFIGFQLSGSLWGNITFWALVCVLCRSSRRTVEAGPRARVPAAPALTGPESSA